MAEFMTPKTKTGAELRKLLMKELAIPDNATSFEVRFAIDEIVSVRVEYLALEQTKKDHEG